MKQNISKIFNRTKLINNRLFQSKHNRSPQIFQEAATKYLCDNVSICRKTFDRNVVYFGQDCFYFLENAPFNFQPNKLFICDIAPELLQNQIQQIEQSAIIKNKFPNLKIQTLLNGCIESGSLNPICCDEELWPFADNSIQLIISSLHLHYVNDLQVAASRWLNSLEPDGTGCIYGSDTLQELRISYTLAENERYGGVSQHVSPFVSITEVGNLITRLKYTIPTVFTNKQIFEFESVLHLLQVLQESGESEALLQVRKGVYRDTLEAMIAIYSTLFLENNKIYSTIEFVNFAGWKYHIDQQKPKDRGKFIFSNHQIGSADFSLKQLSTEIEKEGGLINEEGLIEEEEDTELDKKDEQNSKK